MGGVRAIGESHLLIEPQKTPSLSGAKRKVGIVISIGQFYVTRNLAWLARLAHKTPKETVQLLSDAFLQM